MVAGLQHPAAGGEQAHAAASGQDEQAGQLGGDGFAHLVQQRSRRQGQMAGQHHQLVLSQVLERTGQSQGVGGGDAQTVGHVGEAAVDPQRRRGEHRGAHGPPPRAQRLGHVDGQPPQRPFPTGRSDSGGRGVDRTVRERNSGRSAVWVRWSRGSGRITGRSGGRIGGQLGHGHHLGATGRPDAGPDTRRRLAQLLAGPADVGFQPPAAPSQEAGRVGGAGRNGQAVQVIRDLGQGRGQRLAGPPHRLPFAAAHVEAGLDPVLDAVAGQVLGAHRGPAQHIAAQPLTEVVDPGPGVLQGAASRLQPLLDGFLVAQAAAVLPVAGQQAPPTPTAGGSAEHREKPVQRPPRHLLGQGPGGTVLEVVGLVADQMGDLAGDDGVAQQQGVVDNGEIGIRERLSGPTVEAEPLQIRARRRRRLAARDAPAQGSEVAASLGQEPAAQVVPVARGGAGRPARHHGQRPSAGRVCLVQFFQLIGQIRQGEVVGGPFEHGPVERTQRLLQFHEGAHHLVLQHLGVGGYRHGGGPGWAGPGQRHRGGQIGQGLAGAGGGLYEGGAPFGQRGRHLAGHLLLLRPVAAAGPADQRPARGQRRRRLSGVERPKEARQLSARWRRSQRRRQGRGLGQRRGQQPGPGVAGPVQQPALQVAVGPVGVQELQQLHHHRSGGLGVGQGPMAGLGRRDSQLRTQVVQGESSGWRGAVGVGLDRLPRAGEGQQSQLHAVEAGSTHRRQADALDGSIQDREVVADAVVGHYRQRPAEVGQLGEGLGLPPRGFDLVLADFGEAGGVDLAVGVGHQRLERVHGPVRDDAAGPDLGDAEVGRVEVQARGLQVDHREGTGKVVLHALPSPTARLLLARFRRRPQRRAANGSGVGRLGPGRSRSPPTARLRGPWSGRRQR